MDQKQFASLGGLAAAKALTAEQRIERATVASDAARIARAALRKAKALGIAKPDTASRRWRQTRTLKAIAAHKHDQGAFGPVSCVNARARNGQWADHIKVKRGKQRIVR